MNSPPDQVRHLVGEDSEFWPDKYPCPSCEKHVRGFVEFDVDPQVAVVIRFVDLSAEEAYAAFNGFGLPEEGNCTILELSKLFINQKVRAIAGSNVMGTTRSILRHIEFEDGTKIYFAAGADGACVYRMVKPFSYVEKLNDG